jgi:hypothetical protein
MPDLRPAISRHVDFPFDCHKTAHGTSLGIPGGGSLFISDGQPVSIESCAYALRRFKEKRDA